MDDTNNIPAESGEPESGDQVAPAPTPPQPAQPETPTTPPAASNNHHDDDQMNDRLERLGGEPAPVITPEEFARLQQAGQVHIDSRGRVRTTRRSDSEAGVSLRKRRAWYGS
jgi:hypothetical protein